MYYLSYGRTNLVTSIIRQLNLIVYLLVLQTLVHGNHLIVAASQQRLDSLSTVSLPSRLSVPLPGTDCWYHPVFPSPFLLSSAVRHWLLPLPLARTETKNPTFLLRAASTLLPPALPALATLRQVSLHFCPGIRCATPGLSLIS